MKYVYCKKSYENDGMVFNEGYIEMLSKGEFFKPNDCWRYATENEVEHFLSIPIPRRPKGRYFN